MNSRINSHGVARLDHWGLIRAVGPDAGTFLQGQLTNDVVHLGADAARLAGFCSAKGRLQASFVVWKAAEDAWWLACSADLLASTVKRLSMFVLRARCQLSDATPHGALYGALGDTASAHSQHLSPWQVGRDAHGDVVRLPDVDGVARALLVGWLPDALAPLPTVALDAWRLLEVRSGVPTIEASTVDHFVPQMLNYELIGGVDFKKGCYPGQEVVARSQYRGTVKRRTFLFECAAAAQPAQEVYHSLDPLQPAGAVVNAAPAADGRSSWALVEVKLETLSGGSLHLGEPQGATLHRHPLPYEAMLHSAATAG